MNGDEVQTEIALTIKAYLDAKRRVACLRSRLRRVGSTIDVVATVLEGREPKRYTNPLYDIASDTFRDRVATIEIEPVLADLQSLREALAEKEAIARDLADSGYTELLNNGDGESG
ncbi:MAG: hypothetical protein OXG33_07300 [Chloroflexi bacterium]|nr:hypothetical protein [Chloroflexota bacterium]